MISQIDLITAIVKHLEKRGVKEFVPRQYNAIISAANLIVEECAKPPVRSSPGMGIMAWLISDDTGMSSEYMAGELSGQFSRPYAHPYDADDFGRCSRLLVAVPELRERLDQMRLKSAEWSRLVYCWEQVEAAIRSEDYADANSLVVNAVRSAQTVTRES